MSEGTESGSRDTQRRGSRWILWLVLVVCVFVGGGLFYHFSSANSSRYFLTVRDGSAVIRKGIFFPTGDADFEGGPAYAHLPLPEGFSVQPEVFDDLATVDRAIYGLLVRLARGAMESEDPARLEDARSLLDRARLLPALTEEEADEVLRYRGDLAVVEGKLALREVGALLERARERLERARSRGTRIYTDPEAWIAWIDTKLAEFKAAESSKQPPGMIEPEEILEVVEPEEAPALPADPPPVPPMPPATTAPSPPAGPPAAPAPAGEKVHL